MLKDLIAPKVTRSLIVICFCQICVGSMGQKQQKVFIESYQVCFKRLALSKHLQCFLSKSLHQQDIFWNQHYFFFQQAPPGFESVFCSCSCEETQKMEKAVAHCEDCKEDLCEGCYQAHIRVRITKEHRITWLHGKNPLLNSGNK